MRVRPAPTQSRPWLSWEQRWPHSTVRERPSSAAVARPFGADIESRWPFANAANGSRFPLLPEDDRFSGFLVVASDNKDAVAEIVSVSLVAKRWSRNVRIIVADTGEAKPWLADLGVLRPPPPVEHVPIATVTALRPSRFPFACYVDGGRLLDATVALSSPSVVAERFTYVASPLDQEMFDERATTP